MPVEKTPKSEGKRKSHRPVYNVTSDVDEESEAGNSQRTDSTVTLGPACAKSPREEQGLTGIEIERLRKRTYSAAAPAAQSKGKPKPKKV